MMVGWRAPSAQSPKASRKHCWRPVHQTPNPTTPPALGVTAVSDPLVTCHPASPPPPADPNPRSAKHEESLVLN